MIVCMCEGVSDREIRSNIQQGATSLSELAHRCHVGQDCGRCRVMLRALVREHSHASTQLERRDG